MESLTICCSPRTYRDVENDDYYRLKVTQDVLSKQDETYDEIIFTQSSQQELTAPEETFTDEATGSQIFTSIKTSDDKQNWHDAATKLMLSLVQEMRPKLGKSIYVKTKAKMYQLIANKMCDKGYSYTPIQIENKFRGLERSFKKTVLNNRQTGRNRQTCSYYDELNLILGKKKGINPEFVLDSEDINETSRNPLPVDDRNSDTENSLKDEELSPKKIFKSRFKPTVREKVLEKIEESVKEKKNFHDKVLHLMKKKDERAEKREERSQKKFELLEMLVKQRSQ